MPSLQGRRFYFATGGDLRPGLATIEGEVHLDFLLYEMRDDASQQVFQSLRDFPEFGICTSGAATTSPPFLIFGRGKVPSPRGVGQRKGGTKFVVDPTSDSLILHCGGLHPATGALVAGELQLPLSPSAGARELFELFSRELFRGFHQVRAFQLGPEAHAGFKSGQRLVSIGVRSPSEYDLREP